MPVALEQCPACASPEFKETGPEAPPIAVVVRESEFRQPAYRIRECRRCGLLYRTPVLSPEEFAHYYALVEASKWEIAGYYPTERALRAVLRRLPSGSRILDFGCSSGRLLADLTSSHECFGFEINAEAAAAAASKGLRMLSAQQLEKPGDLRFDAIMLVDVFEHLLEPTTLLRKLTGLLTAAGSLMIVTGNGDAKACRRDPAQFWYFRIIEHVSMLTRQHADFVASELQLHLTQWSALHHYDLSLRERLLQEAQRLVYGQFRTRTPLARRLLQFLPGFRRLRIADVAPSYTASRDHVLAVFQRTSATSPEATAVIA